MTYTSAELRMVDDHIAQGERHVTGQEELVERLRTRGLPTAEAEALLELFKATLDRHREHRELMLRSAASS